MMKTRVKNVYKRSQQRKKKREFNNIIELIEIFSKDYLKNHSSLVINSLFGSQINIGKFDNSGKRPLQLKVFSSGGNDGNNTHPGTNIPCMSWMDYSTWVHCLDAIDSIDRDYLIDLNGESLFSTKIKNHYDVENNDDFEILIAQIDELEEKCEVEKDVIKAKKYEAKLFQLKTVAEEVKETGKLKKLLAQFLINCLSWVPEENEIDYEDISEIPNILSSKIEQMKSQADFHNQLQPEQMRAADLLFFVAVCENFRTPGAVKYMRSCLRHLIKENLSFKEVFGKKLNETICTLSAVGGTAVTRNCFETGNFDKLSTQQKKPYEALSDSSEDEIEEVTSACNKKKMK